MDVIAFLHDLLIPATLSSAMSYKKMHPLSNYEKNIKSIPIARISPNLRLCYSNEAILTLCHAIDLEGQREPIKVLFDGDVFKIIDGERRWRACKRLGITHLKSVITEIYYLS